MVFNLLLRSGGFEKRFGNGKKKVRKEPANVVNYR
jgi:hypothetical protein